MNDAEIYRESSATVQAVARRAGVDSQYAGSVLDDLHHVIDRLLMDNHSVLLSPLIYAARNDPVVQAIAERFTDEDWENPEGYKLPPWQSLADYLGLPVEAVEERSPAFGSAVWDELCTWREVPLDDHTEAKRLDDVMTAWRDHMREDGVSYRVCPAGREADLDRWLEENIHVLGFPLRVVSTQHRFGNNKRLDFLCEFVEAADPFEKGDLWVIENKVGVAGMTALGQLAEYVRLTKKEVAKPGQWVGGVLLCDGTTVELPRELDAADLMFMTLTEIGYRDHLYREAGLARVQEEDETTQASNDAVTAIEPSGGVPAEAPPARRTPPES